MQGFVKQAARGNPTVPCTGTNQNCSTCSIQQACFVAGFGFPGGYTNAGQVSCGSLMDGVCNHLSCLPRTQTGSCSPVSTVASQSGG